MIVGEAFVAVKPDADDFGKQMKSEVGDAADGSADEFSSKGKSSWASAGKVLGGAAAVAAGTAIVNGVMEGMEHEKLNDRLAAQLDLSAPEAERAGEVAGELYAGAYGESMGQVNDTVGAVMSSLGDQIPDDLLDDISANALDLAATFEVDVAESTALVGTMLRQGLVEDAEAGMDQLTSALQRVPAAMRDELIPVMDEYADEFASLGFDGEEAFGMIVGASDKGRLAIDKTGDALKEFSIRATDMSTASQDAYDQIGLDAENMTNRILEGGDTASEAFDEIVDGLLQVENPADRAQAAIALFGTPIEDLGVSGIPDFLSGLQDTEGAMGDVGGAADRMGDKLNDNAATKIESFKRTAMMGLTEFLGGVLIPAVEDAAGWLTDTLGPAFEAIGDWWEVNGPAIIDGAEAVGDTLATVGDTLVGLGDTIASALGSIQGLWGDHGAETAGTVMQTWNQIAGIVRSATDAVVAVVRFVVGTVEALWRTFGDIIMGVVRPVWNNLRRFIGATMENIRQVIEGVLRVIQGIFETFAGLFTGDWSRMWGGIQQIVSGAWSAIHGIFSQAVAVVQAIVTNLWEVIRALVQAGMRVFISLVKKLVSGVVGWFSNLRKRGSQLIRDLVSGVVGFITDMRKRGSQLVRDLVGAVVGFFEDLRSRGSQAVRDLFLSVVGTVLRLRDRASSIFRGLRDRVVDTIVDLFDRVRDIKDTVLGFFDGAKDWLLDAGRNIITGLINGIREMIPDVGGVVDNAVSAVTDRWPWSPAKKGPLRDKPPEEGGRNIIRLLTEGMGAEVAGVAAMSDRVAAAASVQGTGTAGSSGAAGQARTAAVGQPIIGGDLVIYSTDARRSGDEVIRSLREQVYLGTQLTGKG